MVGTLEDDREPGCDLSGMPTGYIRGMLLSRPSDPRYPEALRELNRRGEVPGVLRMSDEAVETALTSLRDRFSRTESESGMDRLKKKAAQALGLAAGDEWTANSRRRVVFKGMEWTFRLDEGVHILEDVKLYET